MFESASETPPPSTWDAIEKRLDGDNTPAILPLVWWKNPRMAYAAAAAVALLLVSWPILQLTRERNENAPHVATRSMKADSPEGMSGPEASESAASTRESLALAEGKDATPEQKTDATRRPVQGSIPSFESRRAATFSSNRYEKRTREQAGISCGYSREKHFHSDGTDSPCAY